MTRLPEIDAVDRIIRDVAAEEVVPRFRALASGDIREKGPGDYVTIADEASERALSRRLAALMPGSLVVGEEAVAADESVMDYLQAPDPIWILDPIDGTVNFVDGDPRFGMIVSLAVGGEIVMGWIFDPIGQRMTHAERGSGAFVDGRRASVARPADIGAMSGHVVPWIFKALKRPHASDRYRRFGKAFTVKCCAHEYVMLAEGQSHFAIYRTTKAWDHAAGWLIHGEAGGYSATFDGKAYAFQGSTRQGLIMAPDEACWSAVHSLLFDD